MHPPVTLPIEIVWAVPFGPSWWYNSFPDSLNFLEANVLMRIRRLLLCLSFFAAMLAISAPARAQEFSATVVVQEPSFPSADTASPANLVWHKILPGAQISTADQLSGFLQNPVTKLLVLPYGSAFPEAAWSYIHEFLRRGGNLLVFGGRPFTRSAYQENGEWHLRDYNVRFIRQLSIDQYQSVPGSSGLTFVSNPDIPLQIPAFAWKGAFSPVIRLSQVDLYNRGGAAGSIDARLDPLAWGRKGDRRLAAPILQIDHFQNGFDGARWIFVSADLAADALTSESGAGLIRKLTQQALRGAEQFTARPTVPLYLPGEPIQLQLNWYANSANAAPVTVRISSFLEDQPAKAFTTTATLPTSELVTLPAPPEKGFHIIQSELLEGNTVRAIYRSGFWIRDLDFLRSGPRLSVNSDFFELNGQPLAVVGTTYMSSEVQRLYFEHPNAYVWDQDLAQIQSAGLNMIRSGWWTGWDKFCDENGQPYDRSLRTLEAFLMTARKHNLPVQFNLFAFLPEVLGGVNSYLDPQAVRKQQTLVSAVVSHFHDAPFLAWDLINEPSFSKRLWTMRPNGDGIELTRWNDWLTKRYPDRAVLAAAWNVPSASIQSTIPIPEEIEFSERGMYIGHNSLKVFDFSVFAQESFAGWVKQMRDVIRAAGALQPITVGQDEGGYMDRPTPAFFLPFVDFTTNHSWWQNDALLWDSLVAKQPGKAMLIQETGLQRELNLDETARFTTAQAGALFERKFALSFAQGSGAIEWLWNSNSYMTEGNETPIGAVRPDGSEKEEATVLRGFAEFAKALSPHLKNPRQPSIAIITSQAAQYSTLSQLQISAQRNAVRTLAYNLHLMPYVITENRVTDLGSPKLAILPSPQSLTEAAWQALLSYVRAGGNLLVTGPVSRDEHMHPVNRTAPLDLDATTEPLISHNAQIRLDNSAINVSFDQQKQFTLEVLRFRDASGLHEISLGKGRIFWAAYPVELAENPDSPAQLYSYVVGKLGLAPQFELRSPLPSGVLVHVAELEDSVLYIFENESFNDSSIDLRDSVTGAELKLSVSANHAAIAVLDKKTKSIIAKYGF